MTIPVQLRCIAPVLCPQCVDVAAHDKSTVERTRRDGAATAAGDSNSCLLHSIHLASCFQEANNSVQRYFEQQHPTASAFDATYRRNAYGTVCSFIILHKALQGRWVSARHLMWYVLLVESSPCALECAYSRMKIVLSYCKVASRSAMRRIARRDQRAAPAVRTIDGICLGMH